VTLGAAVALGAAAGAVFVPAVLALGRSLLSLAEPPTERLGRAVGAQLSRALRPLRVAAEEGVLPSDRERARLQAAAAAAGLLAGTYLAGPRQGCLLAVVSAWVATRALRWRRERYRRAVDAGAAVAALAVADALAAGHSIQAAIAIAGRDLEGPVARELRRTGHELELGAAADDGLLEMRRRCRSRRIDLLVAAIRIQRRSGGALAGQLREMADTIDARDRLDDEARAARAQARFTSLLVLLLPLFGLLLAELAAPGFAGRMLGSSLSSGLLVVALALQVTGAMLVRRLARVEA
jgi:tight adherence protein B